MRYAFINTLTKLARKDKRIYLLTGDLGFMAFEKFRTEFKERFINMGVAESNMAGVAAGLALSEKLVFIYSIIPFITYRCLEHIRNDICYHNLRVRIVGIGGGYSYGPQGATHHALEDIGVMSALPNMSVICPGDPLEVEAAVRASIDFKGPLYIRLGKAGEPKLHNNKTITNFRIGRGIKLCAGNDLTLIATGNVLQAALEVARLLKNKRIHTQVISMHTVKPIDRELILNCAKQTKFIFTLEEHGPNGGLASIVAFVLASAKANCHFHSFHTPPGFIDVIGQREYLCQKAGISVNAITQKIISKIAYAK